MKSGSIIFTKSNGVSKKGNINVNIINAVSKLLFVLFFNNDEMDRSIKMEYPSININPSGNIGN